MLTKLPVDADQLAAIVAPLGDMQRFHPLEGGLFASTFAVDIATRGTSPDSHPDDEPSRPGEQRVVVKVTGDDFSRLLRYERGILGTEALVYRLAADVEGLPTPRLLRYDDTRSHLDGTAVVAQYLPGDAWASLALDHAQTGVVLRGLGAAMARLHTITGDRFGYPAPESDLAADTWPVAFVRMMGAVLDDADRFGVELPTPRIRDAVARNVGWLTVVDVPRLVHTDLWPGNVFLDDQGQVSGLIDPERALWGDPLFEFAGADQMGIGPVPEDLLTGYRSVAATGAVPDVDPQREHVRLDLYKLYFSVLMTVEATPRGYEGDWVPAHMATLRSNMVALLDRLEG